MDTVSDKKIDKLIATQGMTRVYELEDGSWLTARDGTVAWRNNNPGNLKFGFKDSVDTPENRLPRTKEKALHSAQAIYQGVVDLDQWGNAVFESYEAGRAAQESLLRSNSMCYKTVEELVKSYSTKDYSGDAHHANQIKAIYQTAAAEGFDLHGKKVVDMSPAELNALADGLSKAESWKVGTVEKTPPLNAEQLHAALASHAHAKEPAQAAQNHFHQHTLRQGDHGVAVGTVQQQLHDLGYKDVRGNPLPVDKDFGPSTDAAVKAFQQSQGLKADGIVGKGTATALTAQIGALEKSQSNASVTAGIASDSSIHDMFESLCAAAAKGDHDGLCAVGQAYMQSPQGQADLTMGAQMNQMQAQAQQAQQALMMQQTQAQQATAMCR